MILYAGCMFEFRVNMFGDLFSKGKSAFSYLVPRSEPLVEESIEHRP